MSYWIYDLLYVDTWKKCTVDKYLTTATECSIYSFYFIRPYTYCKYYHR